PLLRTHSFPNLVGMAFGFGLGNDMLDDAFFIDNKGRAFRTHVSATHEFLFPKNAIIIDHFFVFIRNEGKRQIVFAFKFFVAFGAVNADANDFITFFLQIFVIIPEVTGLSRAAGGIVFGIKIKDHLFAFVIFQRDLLAILVRGIYSGCFIAFF